MTPPGGPSPEAGDMRKSARTMVILSGAVIAAGGSGCRRLALADQEQVGNAAGDVMASLDESVDGRVMAAFRTPDQLRGPSWRRALEALESTAYAASCF